MLTQIYRVYYHWYGGVTRYYGWAGLFGLEVAWTVLYKVIHWQ